MTVAQFEDAVWRIESIRIVVRASLRVEIGTYGYERGAPETWTLSEWLQNRVNGQTQGCEVEIIKGDGKRAHRGQLVRTTRAGYARG